jgi:hypothetical protein
MRGFIDPRIAGSAAASACSSRARRIVSAWSVVVGGFGLACLALACPEKNEDDGTAGAPPGGTGGQPSEPAPACATERAPFVVVSSPLEPGQRRVRVLALGFGVPEGIESVPASPNGHGWVRLAVMLQPNPDAADAGAPVYSSGGAELFGPRELGELAVAPGDELELTYQAQPLTANLPNRRYILERDGRVLFFHQASYSLEYELGTFSGLTLALGDAVCTTPFQDCADIHRHELVVTVPGSETAVTLAPGASQTIGGYRVLHGNTETVTFEPGYAAPPLGTGGRGPDCRTVKSRTEITVVAVNAEE